VDEWMTLLASGQAVSVGPKTSWERRFFRRQAGSVFCDVATESYLASTPLPAWFAMTIDLFGKDADKHYKLL